jgi:hypothetical protein
MYHNLLDLDHQHVDLVSPSIDIQYHSSAHLFRAPAARKLAQE